MENTWLCMEGAVRCRGNLCYDWHGNGVLSATFVFVFDRLSIVRVPFYLDKTRELMNNL